MPFYEMLLDLPPKSISGYLIFRKIPRLAGLSVQLDTCPTQNHAHVAASHHRERKTPLWADLTNSGRVGVWGGKHAAWFTEARLSAPPRWPP